MMSEFGGGECVLERAVSRPDNETSRVPTQDTRLILTLK